MAEFRPLMFEFTKFWARFGDILSQAISMVFLGRSGWDLRLVESSRVFEAACCDADDDDATAMIAMMIVVAVVRKHRRKMDHCRL